MFDKEQELVLREAIYKKGRSNQLTKAVEECAEVIKAVCKIQEADKAGEFTENAEMLTYNLADEIADAKIMLRQLEMMLNVETQVTERIDYKIKRLKTKLS